MVLMCCTKYVDESGNVRDLDDESRKMAFKIINSNARQAKRTLSIAYKDL